jgi:hypothetical protein
MKVKTHIVVIIHAISALISKAQTVSVDSGNSIGIENENSAKPLKFRSLYNDNLSGAPFGKY